MSTFELTRRAALVALVALAGSPAVAARRALARAGPSGGIRVDVAPLLENSGQPTAGWVAQTLPAAISQALAATGRTGVSVAVTIDSVILGPNSGGVGPGHSPDQIVGTVTIAGVERPLRATSTYYPSPVDNTVIAQSNYNRVYQLSQAFAYWVAREV
ncbi:MAG TPA: hypothetical protein VJY34_12230 [Roseiarcus sp.]|nr:hypothetical protein [Roseiarcus sp.]